MPIRRESRGGTRAAPEDGVGSVRSEFAGRHQQYEKFYGGASFLVKQTMYRSYDFARAERLVDAALSLPDPEIP